MELKEMLAKFEGALEKTGGELKQALDAQNAEMKEFGETTKETASKIARIEQDLDDQMENIKSLRERLDGFEKQDARGRFGEGVEEFKSAGEIFANHETVAEMYAKNGHSTIPVAVKNLFARRKEIGSFAVDGTTRLVEPLRSGDIVAPTRRLRIRDLLRVIPTDRDSVQYIVESGFSPVFAKLASAGEAADTTITVDNARGFTKDQTISIGSGANAITRKVTSINYGTNVLTLDSALGDAFAEGQPVGGQFLGATPDRMLKPMADLTLDLKTEAVKTIAAWLPGPKQILADMPRLRRFIDDRLMYALAISEEQHLLYGDGSDAMLQGILTHALRQTYAWSEGAADDTKVDAIRRAATRVSLADYDPEAVVMHPLDWEDIELLKGSDKHYIWVSVTDGGVERLWRMPVVVTRAINQGQALTGAFSMASVLYDREQAFVQAAEQHEDFFVRNMVAILAEQRLMHTIERPEAYVDIEFDNAPTAGS